MNLVDETVSKGYLTQKIIYTAENEKHKLTEINNESRLTTTSKHYWVDGGLNATSQSLSV